MNLKQEEYEFKRWLCEKMRQLDLTGEQLARRARLSTGYISQLKQGVRKNPSKAAKKKLARALQVPESEIEGHAPNINLTPPAGFPSYASLFLALDDLPIRCYVKDLHGCFLWANKATLAAHGIRSLAELVGKSDATFFNEDHASEAKTDELTIIQTGKPVLDKSEVEIWQLDKRIVHVLTSKLPLRDISANIIGIFGISKDITDLRNTQDIMRSIFNIIPDGVFFKDRKGKIQEWNKAFEDWHRALGVEDFKGKTDFQLWPHRLDLARAFVKGDNIVFKTRKPYGPIREKHVDQMGNEIAIETTKFPLFNSQGELVGLVGIFADYTARLSGYRKHILESFHGPLTHSIRNWVDVVLTNLDLARTDPNPELLERALEYLTRIHRFIRLDSLRGERSDVISINTILKDASIGDPDVTVQRAPHGWRVECCSLMLKIGLEELIYNAKRFRNSRSRIWVERDQVANIYEFHVTDDGPGVSPAIVPRLFEPGATTDPRHTGLGLASVKKIAQAHQGSAQLVHSDTTGAHFTLRIPFSGSVQQANGH